MRLFPDKQLTVFLLLYWIIIPAVILAQPEVISSGNSSSGIDNDPVYDVLVWSDEFETDGPIDGTKWFHQTQLPNGVSWYNGEIQHYTNRIENSYVDNGTLKIVAKREMFTDQGQTKEFTSARLNSKYTFTYGRVEIRAKLPSGVGTWPALWMLGKNINEPGAYWQTQGFGTVGWPDCGEMDIMEHWGDNQNYVSSATHTPSSFGNTVNVGGQTVPTASTAFHVYSVDWYPDRLVFQVDGNTHYTYQPSTQDANTWPFDAEQYFIFNVAMLPNVQPGFTESELEVDYIRVYQESTLDVDEIDFENHVVYPNPVTDTLHIDLKNRSAELFEAALYSIDGKLVRSFKKRLDSGRIELNISEVPTGFYFLVYALEDKTHILKFIKN